ncbi:MAG: replication factor C small subunit [Thermoplasmata archaeon]
MEEIWVEKYRPQTLDKIIGQKDIVDRLKAYVHTKNLPHLLFAGGAGTGKTTSAIALARELFGENWRQVFQELNASDERGIQVVRTKIKDFARTAPMGDTSFKIIFLDEADALTSDAQSALRRTMESYSHTCRFILSCNYSSRIITPIQSRCAVFRFRPLKNEDLIKYLKIISEEEGLNITQDALNAIVYIAAGDMRKAINSLQVAAAMGKKIDAESVYKTTATARPEEVRKLLAIAIEGDFLKARDHLDVLLINYGLSGEDILKQIHREVYELGIKDELKIQLVNQIGEVEFRLSEGSNDRIQLESLLAYITNAAKTAR